VVVVGTVTLLVGAWIGCAKDDIKKALAGSTMSQIGYMMLAAGIGPAGYAYAIFHLITHGFFKANMFLGAGSVMHAMDDDVDMRHYGGLSRVMRITFVTFAAGYLAIIGFPFLSGYYSKDHIIEAAFEQSALVGVLAMLGAGVTAFYMTRVMLMTFFGEKRWQQGVHPHESPLVMTVPLIILGVGSVFSGLALNNWISGWLDPAVGGEHSGSSYGLLHFTLVGVVTLVVVAAGVGIAVLLFGPRKQIPTTQPASRSPFTLAGRRDLYGDAINEAVFMRPGQQLTDGLVRLEDRGIDGTIVGGTATAITELSGKARRIQNGFVRSYAATMVVGAALIGVVLILGRLG
jgi:NADH-quinone oxidoreductase subunit L